MEIDDRYVAATPEGVSLEFVLAGLGSRFVALFLDLIIQAVAIVIVAVVVQKTVGSSTPTRSYIGLGAIALADFLLILGYFVLFESLNAGRSPGKAMTGLRVVRVTGGPVGFRASLLRNVVRIADWLPALYSAGAVLIVVTRNNQRLGDMVAGTLVIRDRSAVSRLNAGTAWNQQAQWGSTAPVGPGWAGLPAELAHWDVTQVSAQEVAVVARFLSGRAGYTPEARAGLAVDLASRLWPRVAGPTGPMEAEAFLEAVALVKSVRG